MAKKKAAKSEATDTGPGFEESLSELQQIVADLEDGELGLESSLKRFEEGISLIRRCYQTLEAAEQKIEILTGVSEEGEARTAPFDSESTWEQSGGEAKRRQSTGRKKESKSKTSKKAESKEDGDEDPRKMLF